MAVSKVILNGTTLIDTTDKTVTSESMLSGVTALKNDGTTATGTYVPPTFSVEALTVTPSDESQTFDGYTKIYTIQNGRYNQAYQGSTQKFGWKLTPTPALVEGTTYHVTGEFSYGSVNVTIDGEWEYTLTQSGSYKYSRTMPFSSTSSSTAWVGIEANSIGDIYFVFTANSTISAGSVTVSNEIVISKKTIDGYLPVTVEAMPSGTAGTPTATKGTVSNHSVSVTPSVTNTTGYITGGTKNGTAVTVTASELESGTKTITENGTGIDVTGYAAVDVDVPSSGGVTVSPLSVTQNGTYTAPSGTAYSPVTVNVSGGGGNSDFRAVIEGTATNPTLPSDLTVIRDYAFEYYSTLALTSLPSGITSIGQYAFYNCSNLALTSLPNGLTSIGQYAFYNCSNLALTSLPNGLTSIGQYAFSNCQRMEIDSLPLSITGSIPANVFTRCLKITISSVPSGVTSIGQYAFSECNSIISMAFPNTVTSIAGNAFYNCANLEQVNGTGIITSIANSAFTRCPRLKTAAFPNASMASLYTIFGNTTAAYADNLLEFADIGSTKAIAANAFANCYALETLVLRRSDAICTLANVSAFLNTPMRGYNSLTGTVYVPSALISTYQTATNWSTLYNDGTVTFAAIEGSDYELD